MVQWSTAPSFDGPLHLRRRADSFTRQVVGEEGLASGRLTVQEVDDAFGYRLDESVADVITIGKGTKPFDGRVVDDRRQREIIGKPDVVLQEESEGSEEVVFIVDDQGGGPIILEEAPLEQCLEAITIEIDAQNEGGGTLIGVCVQRFLDTIHNQVVSGEG